MCKGYIYRHWIINDENIERNYIGQTTLTLEQRWGTKGHRYGRKNTFAKAIKKYGWDNFTHEVLLIIECETEEELGFWLDEWEKYYIEKYDSYYNGYNSTLGGKSRKGYKTREETKRKLSERFSGEGNPMYGKVREDFKGNKNPMRNPDIAKKITGAGNGTSRKVVCVETGKVFDCIADAERWCNNSGVSKCLRGYCKTASGYHWMYYSDYLEQQNNSNPTNNKVA